MRTFLTFLLLLSVALPSVADRRGILLSKKPSAAGGGGGSSLLTDLVAYWKLDEASGSRADSIGSSTLTDNATVGSAAGKQGNAAVFDSNIAAEYLSAASSATLQAGDVDWTIAFWVNVTDLVGNYSLVSKDADSPANSRDYTIEFFAPGTTFRTYVNGGTGVATWSATISAGTWYFVEVYHDATADTLSINVNNGTPVSASTGGAAPQTSSAEFRIGGRAYSGFENFSRATIDEVGIWKRKLTAGERTTLYGGGSGTTHPF